MAALWNAPPGGDLEAAELARVLHFEREQALEDLALMGYPPPVIAGAAEMASALDAAAAPTALGEVDGASSAGGRVPPGPSPPGGGRGEAAGAPPGEPAFTLDDHEIEQLLADVGCWTIPLGEDAAAALANNGDGARPLQEAPR